MSWELIVISCLLVLITGIAGWSMRKSRKTEPFKGSISVDTNELARKIAKAISLEMRVVLKEILQELRKSPISGGRRKDVDEGWSEIGMDESVIPIDISVDVEAANLEGAATEQKVIDKDLDKSKSKLAGFLKGRKK